MDPDVAMKSLAVSIRRSISCKSTWANGVLTRMTKHRKKRTRAENIIKTITMAKIHWAVPRAPATKACLISEVFSERVIMVALRRKALVRVSLKATASASALEGSNKARG